ncbi:putative secreted glycosyl hydrolase [Aspergillus undulatus]|uniref:putative secreted glycosyl hydrolase n=1 Tax=Aspergillus undulatus TaxID=1810928 RepID=UPI003CCCBE90
MQLQLLPWLVAALVAFTSATATATQNGTQIQGIDLFEIHLPVNYNAAAAKGVEFVYVKATEGLHHHNLRFASQTRGAVKAGLFHGAVHFALASKSSGAEQAEFFINHGGNWTADGKTLPGVLEMEGNIAGKLCHGMNSTEITDWMADFSNTYKKHTGRPPMLFLSKKWWTQCAGDDGSLAKEHPLWLANWNDETGDLPVGWEKAHFWQYSGFSSHGGEADVFLGSLQELRRFALDH